MVDNHFSLLDIKLYFSGLLVRNAKLVSFFFVRFYLSTKTKIQCGNETLYFPYTIYGLIALFAPDFLHFCLFLCSFSTTKQKNLSKNARKYRHSQFSTKKVL